MNGMQVTKPAIRQWNILPDSVVTVIKYNKITIYPDIFIKVFSDVTVSCLTVSTDDGINNTHNWTAFPELRRVV